MIAGIPVEAGQGERRVAMVPAVVPALRRLGLEVLVQRGAGERAGFPDAAYEAQGARIASESDELSSADLVLRVGKPDLGRSDGGHFGSPVPADAEEPWAIAPGQVIVGLLDPLGSPQTAHELAAAGVTAFALELLPRISRAQAMDALSSMATLAGYKAALLAAAELHKLYPMMITAAGTITPARVFVVGAGVAGLQAVATSRRLGATVKAYDIRPAVKEQVESLGARFVELDLDTRAAEGEGGYAREMDAEFLRRQRETMAEVVGDSDVVITTAAVPGKAAPVLVTAEMVRRMEPGAVVVDLAAAGGGNCELTRAGETVEVDGVTIMGPVNLPASLAYHASQMYARNVAAFLAELVGEGELRLDLDDPVHREPLLTHEGEVVNPRVRELLGLPGRGSAGPHEAGRQGNRPGGSRPVEGESEPHGPGTPGQRGGGS